MKSSTLYDLAMYEDEELALRAIRIERGVAFQRNFVDHDDSDEDFPFRINSFSEDDENPDSQDDLDKEEASAELMQPCLLAHLHAHATLYKMLFGVRAGGVVSLRGGEDTARSVCLRIEDPCHSCDWRRVPEHMELIVSRSRIVIDSFRIGREVHLYPDSLDSVLQANAEAHFAALSYRATIHAKVLVYVVLMEELRARPEVLCRRESLWNAFLHCSIEIHGEPAFVLSLESMYTTDDDSGMRFRFASVDARSNVCIVETYRFFPGDAFSSEEALNEFIARTRAQLHSSINAYINTEVLPCVNHCLASGLRRDHPLLDRHLFRVIRSFAGM
jgi:hypothetical protein